MGSYVAPSRIRMLYFDYNATAPMLPQARDAWLDATERFIGNPSSPHRVGSRADAALNDARDKLARFLGCDALDIVWTSGATESNNTICQHLARSLPPSAEFWISAIEHPSMILPARHAFGDRLKCIPVTRGGVVDLDWLRQNVRKRRPGAIAVLAANNETGALQPWHEAAQLCREAEIPFVCDATQWIGKAPSAGLGSCDFVTGSAHKFGGPKGAGFLKCPARGGISALLRGGPQEEGRRAGTENVPAVLSMVAALEHREGLLASGETEIRSGYRRAFEEELLRCLPGAEIVGAGASRLWNTVLALMPEADCQLRWVVKLDRLGFAVSTGSACASGKEEPSHVLVAMGYSPADAGRALRFSSGWETPREHWDELIAALVKVDAANRRLQG